MKVKMNRIMNLFMVLVFLSLFIFSCVHIVNWMINNRNNRKINETLHEYIIQGGNDKYQIDFTKLKSMNPDTVAYIKVNNTNIDYIVVKGENNEYYLDHNFNREANKSGWIFADSSNKFDGTDKNIIIYGHNTVDKSMFGTLRRVLTDEWYEKEENRKVILVTENGMNKYEVFSTYKIEKEEYYIQTYFKDEEEFGRFVKELKSRSIYDYKVDVNKDDQILTLSTCSDQGKKRVVLHAKKIVETVQNEV